MSPVVSGVLRVLEYFTSPLSPDDYFGLINPLWSTRETRGRIDRVHRETDDAATLYITPGFRWGGHKPGQYLRVGFDIDGKRYWRAYSLSSDDARPDHKLTVTVKRKDDGVVSQWINSSRALGSLVVLGQVEGEFTLPSKVPSKLLFLTAGSGVTPVMAMLQALERADDIKDVVHVHSSRSEDDAIFAQELAGLDSREDGYRLLRRTTGSDGRVEPAMLDDLVPDWKEREVYACGPGPMLDALTAHFETAGRSESLHLESFEHFLMGVGAGDGGTITLSGSGLEAECDGSTPILVAAESAGADLPFGCRMGICHTCTGLLETGSVRDLRTGDVTQAGTEIRTCVNCPDGPVTIKL